VCLLPLHSTSGAQIVSQSLLEPQAADVSVSARSDDGLPPPVVVAAHRAGRADERVRSGRDEAGLVGVRIAVACRGHGYRVQRRAVCARAVPLSESVGTEIVRVMHVRNTSGHMGHV
jgi:hypothetical protein